MTQYTVVDPLQEPLPMQSPAITLVNPDGTDFDPLSSLASATFRPTGAIAETWPRVFEPSVTTLTSGRIQVTAIALVKGSVVTSISVLSRNVAADVPTNWWFGLFDNATTPAKLAVTADQTTTSFDAFVKKTLPLTSPFTVTYTGLHYIGLCVVANTPPNILAVSTPGAEMGPPILHGYSTSGLTTPASCPSNIAAPTFLSDMAYAYVS